MQREYAAAGFAGERYVTPSTKKADDSTQGLHCSAYLGRVYMQSKIAMLQETGVNSSMRRLCFAQGVYAAFWQLPDAPPARAPFGNFQPGAVRPQIRINQVGYASISRGSFVFGTSRV